MPTFLATLERWTNDHRADLESRGETVTLFEPSPQNNRSSQWLTMRAAEREAELGVWVSGDCETGFGWADARQGPEFTHHDLRSKHELVAVLDALAARLLSEAG